MIMLQVNSTMEDLQWQIQVLQAEVNSLTQTIVQLESEGIEANKKQKKREETFKLFQKLNQEISAAQDIKKIYQITVVSLAESIGFDRVIIYRRDNQEFRPIASCGYEQNWDLERLKHPFWQELSQKDRGIVVNGKTRQNPLADAEADFQIKYFMALPFTVCDRIEHILFVGNQKELTLVRPRLTKKDLEILEMLSNQIKIAFQQIDLYKQSQRSAQEASDRAQELADTLTELQQAQSQLVQSEKMSSLGQLVAGVAHEINNPVNFISGNITFIKDYSLDLLEFIELYRHKFSSVDPEIEQWVEDKDLDFIADDFIKILNSMKHGTERIQGIVKSLRIFSRFDEAECKEVDIHEGLDSTLTILDHRLKEIELQSPLKLLKNYGNLPKIECYAGQLNQVFMNLLSNAIDALEAKEKSCSFQENQASQSILTITTEYQEEKKIVIRIKDNGIGIDEHHRQKIFDPFFTTKPIGKGTGMGLSISYQIITEKHQGTLQCFSTPGEGTEFVIELPIK